MNMGYTYAMMNEYDKSIGCYQKVIGLEPNAVLAYHDAGILCAKEGKDSLAVSYLRRAAQLGHSESRQWLQENGLDW
jgi:tetratricopeptide (TPR) repeat protein